MSELPSYADLPPAPGGGRSGWGLFGAGDNLGLVNLMTPERIAAAARLVRRGQLFCLDMPLGSIAPALATFRGPPRHRVLHTRAAPRASTTSTTTSTRRPPASGTRSRTSATRRTRCTTAPPRPTCWRAPGTPSTSAPLNAPGGIGSPANAVAIK
ncbi:MAG: hypothetical protein ACRDPY_17625 [Streptosporangiaceae bacterium]